MMSDRSKRFLLCLAIVVAGISAYTIYRRSPSYTFNPTCTYDLTYRLTATIELGGERYSSEVIHQRSRSRKWVQEINSGGCQQTYGTALSFRLADHRLILVGSAVCSAALQKLAGSLKDFYNDDYAAAMVQHRKLDLLPLCTGIGRPRPRDKDAYEGFLIDNADHPAWWGGFKFGSTLPGSDQAIHLVSAGMEAADIFPSDNIEKTAPEMLKTAFEYDDWWNSPERILSFHRRPRPYAHTVKPIWRLQVPPEPANKIP
jgi:hypothetical protein